MKILIVDDDIAVRHLVRYALTRFDEVDVREADSALSGLRAAIEHLPDAILLDIVMAEIDGLGMLRLLKANRATSRIPVVILSTAAAASDTDRLRGLGAAAILHKPFDPTHLARDVRDSLRAAA